jgi:hypothetical protein
MPSIPDHEIRKFIREVRERNMLDYQISHYQELMAYYTLHPEETKEEQNLTIGVLNQVFKALLAEKARQETIEKMCNDYSTSTQHSSTRPTYDASGCISVRNILQEKIARS